MSVVDKLKALSRNREDLYAAFGLNNINLTDLIKKNHTQLDELQKLVQACEEKEERIRQLESEEETSKAAAALQPLLEKYDICGDVSAKESVSFAPEVVDKNEEVAADPFAENKESESAGNFLSQIDQEQFATAPTYLKGRMTLGDLNATITALDTQMVEKATLMNKPLKTLKQADKNRVLEWRKQGTEKFQGNIWLTEAEFKTTLSDRLKTQLKLSLPVMRHFRITREFREKNRLFICPYF